MIINIDIIFDVNFYKHIVLIWSLAMNLPILETVIFTSSTKIDTLEYY